jgi:gliding motility-associated-like protein
MRPGRLIIVLALLFFFSIGYAQTCPVNIDFEQGNFSYWQCYVGRTYDSNSVNYVKFVPSPPTVGRHEIISASSTVTKDTFGLFPTLCPYGGQYSVKLGNRFGGAEAEGISYTFTVPTGADTFSFTYYYAVVFEDPGHQSSRQPRFIVSAYDVVTGASIGCSSFNFIADSVIPGFKNSTVQRDVLYKEWTPASLQLGGMQGKQIRLEFTTADCTPGNHFGYGYIDVSKACSRLMATASFCAGANAIILNAPYGYQSYTWYNADLTTMLGATQFVTLSASAAINGPFRVELVPYPGYGCRDTVTAMPVAMSVPDTPSCRTEYNYCQYDIPAQLSVTPRSGNTLLWYDSAIGGVAGFYTPAPSTTTPGTYNYYVSEKVLFGCESERRKITVKVHPIPFTTIMVNKSRQCLSGNLFTFTGTGLYNTDATYYWDFGDGQMLSAVKDSVVNYSYSQPGIYKVDLRIKTKAGCSYERSIEVTVVAKPVAGFSFPSSVCQNQTPVILTNTSNVPGGGSTLSKWWWKLNGNIDTSKVPSPFQAPGPGIFTIALVAVTNEGCTSDTVTSAMIVYAQPTAAISYQQPLCNDKAVMFKDVSTLPPATNGQLITKWNWIFGSVGTAISQNASFLLPAGIHQVSLVVETNQGCTSAISDTIIAVDKKPMISVVASDSCVSKAVRFIASDQQQATAKWYWNFGNGFKSSTNPIVRTYNREGDFPFSVIGETASGCRDTLTRAFSIYSNKAMAGRDTIAAMNEPVQLDAGGSGISWYTWSPAVGLTDANIKNPIATLDTDQKYNLYSVTGKGCESRSSITIKRVKGPALYIPTAFTPNGDGLNDILNVVPVGIRHFKFFAVFNRFGERIFFTTSSYDGWNGTVNGVAANPGTYVAYAEAIDYTNKPIMNKTTVVLIR